MRSVADVSLGKIAAGHRLLRITGRCRLGEVPIHNNAVENEIRPFSQGRRVWLFANNPLGARASANLFSLVSSARANGLEPYSYLNYVFENLPAADTVEALEALLPWNHAVLAAAQRAS